MEPGRNLNLRGKARAAQLAPLQIKKEHDDENSMMIKTDSGFIVSNDSLLQKKGIVLNNSYQMHSKSMPANTVNISSNSMSIESFHPSNFSIDQNNDMSILQESTRKSLSRMSISEESSGQIYEVTSKTTTAYVQDSDGFRVPAPKNMHNAGLGKNRAVVPRPNRQRFLMGGGIGIENISNNNPGGEGHEENGHTNNEIQQEEEKKEENDDKNEIKLEDLQYVGDLGSGSQGHVKKMIHKPTGSLIALKIVDFHTDDNFLKALKTELNTLQECDSDFIVKCYGAFSSGGSINIALEYMDKGSLADLLKKVGTISETILGFITYQVLKGLEHLHKDKKVIHRDIKPSNLLLNSDGQIKIADFGVSGKLDFTLQYKSTWVGTLPYMSPERCKGEKYNFDTDLWSLGLVILECALGKYPYTDYGKNLTFFDLVDILSSKPAPNLPENYSENIKDFVSICLRKEPGTRLSATKLLKHPFVSKYVNVSLKTFQGWLKTT